MAAYLDMTAANAALKELYGPQTIQDMSYKDNPWFAMISKDENCGGKYVPYPTIWSASQGRSSSFATAQANQTAMQMADFMITLKTDYGVATIANQLVEAASSDRESFLKPAKQNIDQMLRTLSNSIASGGFRSGTGSIGKISTIGSVGTGIIQLDDPESVAQFERNQVLQACSTDGGAATAALGYVIKVDRVLSQITVATSGLGGAAANPASWVAGWYLVIQGDLNAKPSGLSGWLPTTAPSAGESFYTVDRSPDTRLYGVAYDGSALSIEEALITGSKFISREGGTTNTCITNYTSYNALDMGVASKQYVEMRASPTLYFKGLTINGHKGPFDVFPDRNCPGKIAYELQTDTWKMLSTNEVPHIFRADGMEMLRVGNADAMEVRAVSYYNYGCNAPGWNGVITLGV